MCIESAADLNGLLEIGKIVAETLRSMRERIRPGMTTKELDMLGWKVLQRHKARPAPLLTYGFPGMACISTNDEAAHGIPGERIIRPGDIVKIDVSAERDGYFADAAITVLIPPVAPLHQRLHDCAKAAFDAALAVAQANTPLNRIGLAAETTVRRQGFHIIRELPGHGVGRALHESPKYVPMFYSRRDKMRLADGLVITIEPHISAGSSKIVSDADGWTLKTQDGSMAAAYEHTIVITKDEPLIITA